MENSKSTFKGYGILSCNEPDEMHPPTKISLRAWGLEGVLASHRDKNSNQVKVSREVLMQDTGIGRSDFSKLVKELKNSGTVTTTTRQIYEKYTFIFGTLRRNASKRKIICPAELMRNPSVNLAIKGLYVLISACKSFVVVIESKEIFVSESKIKKNKTITSETINNYAKVLEELGYISIIDRDENGKFCPTEYVLTDKVNKQIIEQYPRHRDSNPYKENEYQPYKENEYQPYKENEYQPYKENGYQPCTENGYQPQKENGCQPYRENGYINNNIISKDSTISYSICERRDESESFDPYWERLTITSINELLKMNGTICFDGITYSAADFNSKIADGEVNIRRLSNLIKTKCENKVDINNPNAVKPKAKYIKETVKNTLISYKLEMEPVDQKSNNNLTELPTTVSKGD